MKSIFCLKAVFPPPSAAYQFLRFSAVFTFLAVCILVVVSPRAQAEIVYLANLKTDYYAAESGFTVGMEAKDIAATTGSWSFLNGSTSNYLTYRNDIGTEKIPGFGDSSSSFQKTPGIAKDRFFESPSTPANPDSLFVHPSSTQSIDLVWTNPSDETGYTGWVNIDCDLQRILTSGNGVRATLTMTPLTGNPTVLWPQTLIGATKTLAKNKSFKIEPGAKITLNIDSNGNYGYDDTWTHLAISKMDAPVFSDSARDSFNSGDTGNWSYYSTANSDYTKDLSRLTYQSSGMGNTNAAGYGTQSGGVSDKKLYNNGVDVDSDALEVDSITSQRYVVIRWDRPEYLEGAYNLDGSIQAIMTPNNTWDGVAFFIYGDDSDASLLWAAETNRNNTRNVQQIAYQEFSLKNLDADYLNFVFDSMSTDYSNNWGDSFQFSAKISSANEVPEPATWALLILGAFGIAFLRNRR